MRFDIRAGAARGLGAAFLGLLLCGPLLAQPSDQYSDDDIRQTVARVSYLNGGVSYARGDDPDTWQAADLNVPLTLGDRIYTGRGGRAELAVQGGAHIRLDADTDLEALNLTDDTQQFSLKVGAASFQLLRLGQDDIFEVDTPNAAITFDAAGEYRIDVDADGNSRILVRRGRALVAAGGGQVTVGAGDEMDVNGLDDPRYDMVSAGALDGFDRWCSVRVARVQRSRSRQYVNEDIVGVADLDDSGTWEDVPEYGHVWSPARVAADWTPYRDGHWVWQDPWGWTWISTESWGWAPYHYGRWVTARSRWFWVPDAPRTYSRYSPALVAFVGGGGGGAFVGWFPLAPRDPFIPWWGGRRSAAAVTNVTYVNRNHVTIVRQDAFVSGGLVARSIIRDQAVVRGVVAAPVLRGTLPFVPTQASLRVAIRPGLPAAPRPPAAIAQRAVVARIAPPPAPPSFSSKLTVIRENRGAPVAAAAAARIVEQRGPTPQSVSRIRPAASDQGRVTLAPGTVQDRKGRPAAAAPAVQPVPIAPVRGRELATTSRPVAPVAPGGDVRRVERGREPVAQPPTGQPPAGQPAVGKPPVGQPPAGQPPAGQPSAADRQRDADRQRLQQQQQQQQQQKQQQENTRQRQEQERSKVQQPPAQDPKAIQQQQQQQQQKQQQDERQRVLEQQRQQDQQKQQQELKQQQQQQQQQEERRKTLEQQRQQQQEQRQQEQRQRVQSPPPTQPPSDGQDQQKRRELDRQRQQEQQQKQQQQQQQPPPPAERQRREPPAERPGQPPAQQPPAQPPAAAREDRGRQPEAKKPAEKPKDDKAKKDDKKKKDDQDKKDEKKNR